MPWRMCRSTPFRISRTYRSSSTPSIRARRRRWSRTRSPIRLSTAMLSVPRSKVVRGFSFFGVSFVYVIFEDGTDIYWARSPRARIPECGRCAQLCPMASPRASDRTPQASAGSTNTPSMAAQTELLPSCALRRTGRYASRSPRRKVLPRWRASAASCKQVQRHRRSATAQIPRNPALQDQVTPSAPSNMDVGGRVSWSSPRPSSWCAASGYHARHLPIWR